MSLPRHLTGLILVLLLFLRSSAEAADVRLDAHGDPLPQGAVARLGSNRLRHKENVFGAAFAPDGKTFATVGSFESVHLWDVKTGRLSKTFRVGSSARCVCFTPRGDRLIVGGFDGIVRTLDARTGTEKHSVREQHRVPITDLCVSADGKLVLSIDQAGQSIPSDVETGRVGIPYHGSSSNRFSGSVVLNDGQLFMALGSDGQVRKIETRSGQEVHKYNASSAWSHHRTGNQALAVSPDGKHLATAGPNRPLVVMDLATGKVLKRFDNLAGSDRIYSLTFSPNGRFLAASIPGAGLVFLGLASGKELRRLEMDSVPSSVAFAPDGRTVALATGSALVRLLDLATADDVFPGGGHQGPVVGLHFTPDGNHLVSSGVKGEVCLWEVASSRELARHLFESFNTLSLQLTADGKHVQLLGNDGALHRWRLPLNGASGDSTQQATPITNPQMASLAPNGKCALSLERGLELRLHDLAGGSQSKALASLQAVFFRLARFSPDSRRVASFSLVGGIQVWDAATGRQRLSLENPERERRSRYVNSSSLCFSADGRSLMVWDGNLSVYEIASGKERFADVKPPSDADAHNVRLTFSPDGRIVARGNPEGRIVLLATADGAELASWQGGQGAIQALAFSSDGRRLASGGANSTILIWEVPPAARKVSALDAVALARLWQELASDDAQQAYQAMQKLAADPARTVPFFKERMRQPFLDAQRVARLIVDLDDDSYRVREKATQVLAAAGAQIEEALGKALTKAPSEEVRRRLRHLLYQLRRGGMNPDTLRLIRAVEVLDGLGTTEAIRLLRELANALLAVDVTLEIRASLEHHPAPVGNERSSNP